MTGQLLQARERMEAANRKLVQAEKLASIGRLAATIAHEIRNPLTSVKLNIQRIAESEHLDETRAGAPRHQPGGNRPDREVHQGAPEFTRVSELDPRALRHRADHRRIPQDAQGRRSGRSG